MEEKTTRLSDTAVEDAVIGLVLMKRTDVADILAEKLVEDDFCQTETRLIFLAVMDMYIAGQTVFDEITVAQRLREKGQYKTIGGKVKLLDLQSKVPYPPPDRNELDTYVSILKEKTLRRNMYNAGAALQAASCAAGVLPMDGISMAEKTLMELSNGTDDNRTDMPTVIQNAFENILNLYNGKPPEGSVLTGIAGVDLLLGSILPTDYVIIGARPSMGKTAFAANIMENVALQQGKFVAFYSLEMSAEQIGTRMILSQSGISAEQVRRGNITETDFIFLEEAKDKLQKAPIFIDDRAPLDISSIISRSRKLKAEKNLGLIIIDYIQLMTGNRGSDGRQQEVSDISRSLKLLAKELEVPIIALSQLSRSLESRNDKRPQMSDLRESGSLEQDADVVIFLYRDDYYNPDKAEQGITEAIVAKHRNGKVGTAKMYFAKDTTHFYDLEGGGEQQEAEEQPQELQKPQNKKESDAELPKEKEEEGPPTVQELFPL